MKGFGIFFAPYLYRLLGMRNHLTSHQFCRSIWVEGAFDVAALVYMPTGSHMGVGRGLPGGGVTGHGAVVRAGDG